MHLADRNLDWHSGAAHAARGEPPDLSSRDRRSVRIFIGDVACSLSLVLMDSPGPGQMPVTLGSSDEIQEYFQRMAPELFQQLFLRPTGAEGSRESQLPRSEVFLQVFRENAAAMFA